MDNTKSRGLQIRLAHEGKGDDLDAYLYDLFKYARALARLPRDLDQANRGEWLASWLNAPGTTELKREFAELISAMNETVRRRVSLIRGEYIGGGRQFMRSFRSDLAKITRVFSRVTVSPHPEFFDPPESNGSWKGWKFDWLYVGSPDLETTKFAGKALQQIERLSEKGLLDRIRRCQICGRWLFAKHRRQRFCKDSCREKAFRKTPDGRAKRAKYMRKYRKDVKLREESALKAARGE